MPEPGSENSGGIGANDAGRENDAASSLPARSSAASASASASASAAASSSSSSTSASEGSLKEQQNEEASVQPSLQPPRVTTSLPPPSYDSALHQSVSPGPPPAPPQTPLQLDMAKFTGSPQESPASPTRRAPSERASSAVSSSLARPPSAYRDSIRALKESVEHTLSLFSELSTVHASISTQQSVQEVAEEQQEVEKLLSDFRQDLSGIGTRVSASDQFEKW